MLNIEAYKNTIHEIFDDGYSVAITNNKPVRCEKDCDKIKCKFAHSQYDCDIGFGKWALREYSKEPVLTQKQYNFLRALKNVVYIRNNASTDKTYDIKDISFEIHSFAVEFFDKFFELPPIEEGKWYLLEDMLKWDIDDDEY